jgi:DNA primase
MATWVDFAEIRRKVRLEDVIVRFYGIQSLKREENKLIGPCPVHGGDSPRAFHADLEKNVWHCFSKAHGGNVLDFVAQKENISVRDAGIKLHAFFLAADAPVKPTGASGPVPPAAPPSPATPAATPTPAPAPAPAPATPPAPVPRSDGESVNEPLDFTLELKGDHPHLVETRKLTATTIAAFGAGYCSRGTMRGLICLPIHDEDGDLVAYAGRRLKPADIRELGKYKFPAKFAKARVLYRFHAVKEEATERGLVVVEGFFAAMHLYQAGLTNVVATMGVEVSPYQAKLLATAKDLVVIFDGDEAGEQGAAKLKEQLGSTIPVRVVRMPPGVKPDHLPPKMLRWIVNGVQQLDLSELSFTLVKTPTVTP